MSHTQGPLIVPDGNLFPFKREAKLKKKKNSSYVIMYKFNDTSVKNDRLYHVQSFDSCFPIEMPLIGNIEVSNKY
jgi:hypothetical protein